MAATEEELTKRWKEYYDNSQESTLRRRIIAKLISTNALKQALESVAAASKNRNEYVFRCLVELTICEEDLTAIMKDLPNFVQEMVSAYQSLREPNVYAMNVISNISCCNQVYGKITEAFRKEPSFLSALLLVPQEVAAPAIVLISNMICDEDFAKHVLQLNFSHRLIELVKGNNNNLKPRAQAKVHRCVLQLAKHDEKGVIRGNNDVVDALIKWVCDNRTHVSYALLALSALALMDRTVFVRFKDEMIHTLLHFIPKKTQVGEVAIISSKASAKVGKVAIKLLALYVGKEGKSLVDRTKKTLINALEPCVEESSPVGLWAIICWAHLDAIKSNTQIESCILKKLVGALQHSNKEFENDKSDVFPFDLIMFTIRQVVENNNSARDRLCDLKIASKLEVSMQLACIKNKSCVFIHAIHALEKIKQVVCMKDLLQTCVKQLVDKNEDVGKIFDEFVAAVNDQLRLSFQPILANAVNTKAASVELVRETTRGGVDDEAKANAASMELANEATYSWDDEMQDSSYLAQGDEYCPTQNDDNDSTQGDVNGPTPYDDAGNPQSNNCVSSLKMSINSSEPMQKRFKSTDMVEPSNPHAMEWRELGLIETEEAGKLVYTVDNSSGDRALANDGEIKPIGSADLQMLVQDGMLIQVLTFCGLSSLSIKRMHAHFIPYRFKEMCPKDLHKLLITTGVLTQEEANAILSHCIGLYALCRMEHKDFEQAEMPVNVQTKLEEWICECRYRELKQI